MRCAAAVLLATSLLFACSASENLESAWRATGEFRKNYELGQYAQIWSTTGEEFRKVSSEAELSRLLRVVHEKLGSTVDTDQAGFNYNVTTSGTIVTLSYKTKFQKGDAMETFVWRIGGSASPQLLGYNINSKALLLN